MNKIESKDSRTIVTILFILFGWGQIDGLGIEKAYGQERHAITFVVNGETWATIYRADDETLGETPEGQDAMPVDPADNTLSSCGANKFVGWSTTDIGGDAITTAPADLFSNASAGEISVSANTTYYAVFGDSIPANATKGLSLARTVMWSEDWTGESAKATIIGPTSDGGYKIARSSISYGKGNGGGETYIITGYSAGGRYPELIIGKNNGYFSVQGIPRRGAKKLSLSFKQTAYRLYVNVIGTGYSFNPSGTSVNDNTLGSHEYTILCANDAASTFELQFMATTGDPVRIDDIVVKVLEDGATNYRTRCPEVELEVEVKDWSADAMSLEADLASKSATKVVVTVGETSSGAMSVPAAVGGAYFFDLDGTISFIGHAGDRLILDWYNSSDVQVGASWLTVPSIKDAGAATTWSTIASTPTLEDIVVVRNPMAVDETGAKAKRVVLDGGQVEISAGKELVVAETVRRLTGSGFGATEEEDIAIGSTAKAGLGALVMGSHDGTNKATVNFTTLSSGTSGSSASVSQYLGTPFSDATVLSDWYNSWVYGIQYTEHVIGWARVNDGMDPFKGYAVISADGTNHVYWMQGTLVDSETKTIDGLNYQSGTATNPNNENLLANSWMAPIKINAFEAGDFTNADATIYIFNSGSPDNYANNSGSIGTSAGQYSTYTPGSAVDTDVIPAMQSFSVYTRGESASVTLDYNKLVYTPAVNGTTPVANRAPQRRTLGEETDKLHLYAYGESGYGDMVYLLAREDFANGFENGFDGRKVFGETVAPQMYAMTMDGNMAINCVPTMEGTVLGFRKGSGDSEYTFSFEYEGAETLYLNDLKAQTSTLIGAESSYTFTAAADDDEARFIISATPIGQMPTEVERQKSKAERQKIIIHGNLFIIRDGRMYSAEGSLVK